MNEKCGLLHWEINGNQVIDGRNGMAVFLKDDQAFYADGKEADLDKQAELLELMQKYDDADLREKSDIMHELIENRDLWIG